MVATLARLSGAESSSGSVGWLNRRFRRVLMTVCSGLVGWSDLFDAVQQLTQFEWLVQAGPSAQSWGRLPCASSAGKHNQRHSPPLGSLSQRAHQRRAIHDGHLEVEDQCVRAVLAESREGLSAVARRVDLIAVLQQGVGDNVAYCGIVVDDEDARHSRLNGAACVPRLDALVEAMVSILMLLWFVKPRADRLGGLPRGAADDRCRERRVACGSG